MKVEMEMTKIASLERSKTENSRRLEGEVDLIIFLFI